jgi:hypothetical protein
VIHRVAIAAVLAATVLGAPVVAEAQGTCEVNNQASCTVGGDATHAITITIVPAVRMSTPSTTVTLPMPDAANFTAGSGATLAVPFQIRSNTTYTLAVHGTASIWTNSGVGSRANKPLADLEFQVMPGATWTDMTTTPTQFENGTATAATTKNLNLRVTYSWALDTPGSYSIPVQVTVTAP